MEQYYLLRWDFNFADEFDISGFLVVDEAHYKEYLKNLDTFKNEPKFDLVNQSVKDPYFDGLSICFGTNESKMYDTREELLEDISSKEITKEEYETLKKLFYKPTYLVNQGFCLIEYGEAGIFECFLDWDNCILSSLPDKVK